MMVAGFAAMIRSTSARVANFRTSVPQMAGFQWRRARSTETEVADAFWGWQELNTGLAQVSLWRSFCVTSAASNDGQHSSWLRPAPSTGSAVGSTGRVVTCNGAQNWRPDIAEVDMWVFGQDTSRVPWRYTFAPNPSDPMNSPGPCGTTHATAEGTWVHEVGHAYGLGHFDDWISTMNTSQPDVGPCRPGGMIRPSSDAQQAIKNHPQYGLPSAYDVGGTPLTIPAGCDMHTASNCLSRENSVPGGGYIYVSPFSPNSISYSINFTTMIERNALPSGTQLIARVYLSQDDIVDGLDVVFYDLVIPGPHFAGAIYPRHVDLTVPRQILPNGRRCILLQLDPYNWISEFDEQDNLIATSTCFDVSQ